jgi:hypothetical protein
VGRQMRLFLKTPAKTHCCVKRQMASWDGVGPVHHLDVTSSTALSRCLGWYIYFGLGSRQFYVSTPGLAAGLRRWFPDPNCSTFHLGQVMLPIAAYGTLFGVLAEESNLYRGFLLQVCSQNKVVDHVTRLSRLGL